MKAFVAALASLGLVAGQAHPGPAHVGAGNLQGGAHPGPAHVGAGNLQGGAHPCPAFVACRRRRDAQVPLSGYPAVAVPLAWIGAGLPNPLDAAGQVYPAAEPYIHDTTGDSAVEYVHDTAGDRRRRDAQVPLWGYPAVAPLAWTGAGLPTPLDAAGLVYPAAEPYIHDTTGDSALEYVHDTSGDRRRRDAQVPLWGYPAVAPLAWTGAGLPTPLDAAGLVYPAAEPYIHDPSGDSAVEYVHDTAGDRRRRQAVWAYPGVAGYPAAAPWALGADYAGQVYVAAEPYVHDPTGDGADDASPAAEAYVHDASGDSAPAALPYVHDATGDRR